MEQGRLAACHAFGVAADSVPELFPYGIYAVPEISMVGKTEEELTKEGVAYEVGKARYKEIARGQIIGDVTGLLKLIFHSETRKLLGVHIIGEGASELIHIGQAVLSFGGTDRLFRRHGLQLPHPGRVLQGRGLRRDQPAADVPRRNRRAGARRRRRLGDAFVIPGRREAVNPEPMRTDPRQQHSAARALSSNCLCSWVPGSRLRRAPE